jgi:hypothetical protein
MAARLFVAIAVLSEAVCAVGACNVPHYRRVRTLVDTASDVYIDISIRPEDFGPERLICLAGALREKYPGRNVGASIFSSHDAARGYAPSPEETEWLRYCQSKLHAHYSYNKEKHEDYLLIRPDGLSREVHSPFTTRIDLPVTGTPACKLAIDARCLLEFQHIEYPSVEGKTKVSGRVTLAGTIRRDGVLSDLAVVDANASPPERKSVLVDWALNNLGTWRFEPAKHKDAVRITYYFDADLRLVQQVTEVDFRLPSEVRIETTRSN